MTIRHSTGIARVMIPELPPELRTKLHYDPDNAKAALENEQREISALNVQRAAELAQSKLSESQEKQYQAAVELWQKSLATIKGKIQQITEDGIFLYRENDTHPVFIKHADPGGAVRCVSVRRRKRLWQHGQSVRRCAAAEADPGGEEIKILIYWVAALLILMIRAFPSACRSIQPRNSRNRLHSNTIPVLAFLT